jgi:hypothetical protein
MPQEDGAYVSPIPSRTAVKPNMNNISGGNAAVCSPTASLRTTPRSYPISWHTKNALATRKALPHCNRSRRLLGNMSTSTAAMSSARDQKPSTCLRSFRNWVTLPSHTTSLFNPRNKPFRGVMQKPPLCAGQSWRYLARPSRRLGQGISQTERAISFQNAIHVLVTIIWGATACPNRRPSVAGGERVVLGCVIRGSVTTQVRRAPCRRQRPHARSP